MGKANTKKKSISTFDRMMKDASFKEEFDKSYKEFLLSEVLIELMEKKKVSVRKLAKESHLSPTIVQEIRSGKRKNVSLSSVLSIMNGLDCEVIIKDKKRQYALT